MSKLTEITLLNETESAQVRRLVADKSLDYLSSWEPGIYRALTDDGDDLGFVMASAPVADLVNRLIVARS